MKQPATKIILAADAFAYLPIHALDEFKPSENGEDWDKTFDVITDPRIGDDPKILAAVTAPADRGCIQRIIAERDSGNMVVGVCDPLEIIRSKKSSELCIIGGLINRPCFWMIADKHSGNTMSLLNIDFFCQHHRDMLTADTWSKKLFREISPRNSHGAHSIQRFIGDFDDVVDGAVFLKEKVTVSRIAALTPCVLSAALLLNSRASDWNAYKIFDDKRFSKSLTTAFVVHRDALSDSNFEFHERISYFISQIIMVVNFFRNNPTEMTGMIERLCKDKKRFEGERQIDSASSVSGGLIVSELKTVKIRGVPIVASLPVDTQVSEIARNLLHGEDEKDIYSSACDITEIEWNNAIEVYLSDMPKNELPLDSFYSNKILKLAHDRVIHKSLYGLDAKIFTSNRRIDEDRLYYARFSLLFPIIATIFMLWSDGSINVFDTWSLNIKILLSILIYVIGLMAFFKYLKIPKIVKRNFSMINVDGVIFAVWLLLIPLVFWGFAFAMRLVYYGIEENLTIEQLKIYQNNHSLNYILSSLCGLLDGWKIKRDDVYGIITVAVSSWLSLTLGYEAARLGLRSARLRIAAYWPFSAIRNQLRGVKP